VAIPVQVEAMIVTSPVPFTMNILLGWTLPFPRTIFWTPISPKAIITAEDIPQGAADGPIQLHRLQEIL
jgi:hypothetical protein